MAGVEILETKHHTLLSLDACLGLQLLSYEAESVCMAQATQCLTRKAILRDYRDVFTGTDSCYTETGSS